jgi:hypothetical protein
LELIPCRITSKIIIEEKKKKKKRVGGGGKDEKGKLKKFTL